MKTLLISALIILLVGAVGAGCMLRGAPPKTYILSAASISAATRPPVGPVVGVGPVAVPAYLDRRSLVTHEADGEVRIDSNYQWAEPLKDGVTRVVAENLATMIPTDAALVYPWRSPRVVTYRVILEIFRFDGTLGGSVVLNVRWRLLDKDGNELALQTVMLDERPVDATYAALVASHSHLLAAVSQDIATAIRTRNAGWSMERRLGSRLGGADGQIPGWSGPVPGSISTDAASSDLRNAVQGILAAFPPVEGVCGGHALGVHALARGDRAGHEGTMDWTILNPLPNLAIRLSDRELSSPELRACSG